MADKHSACVTTCLPEWVSGIFIFIPHNETRQRQRLTYRWHMFLTAAQYELRNLVNVVPNPTHRWWNLPSVWPNFKEINCPVPGQCTDYIHFRYRSTEWQDEYWPMNGQDVEESRQGLIRCTIPAFSRWGEGKSWISVKVVSLRANIWIQDLRTRNSKCSTLGRTVHYQ